MLPKLQDDHLSLSQTFISCSEDCLTSATFTTFASPLLAMPPFASASPPVPFPPSALPFPVSLAMTSPPIA